VPPSPEESPGPPSATAPRAMSVLAKVRRERMGISESPHVAHHSDWAETSKATVQPVNLEEQWRKDLETAGDAPRYGKKNGDYYEGVVNEQGRGRPGEKMGPAPTSRADAAHHRYGQGVTDPARPKTPPFAWSDGSEAAQPVRSGTATDSAEGWRKNLDEAMSGPRFTKSYGNFHTDCPSRPQPASASRRKADVEGASTFLQYSAEVPTGEPAQEEAAPSTAAVGADWAHTRVAKPAPYVAHEQEWQHNQRLESESIMGRKPGTQTDYAQAIKDAQPDFDFSRSHGDYHIKRYRAQAPFSLCGCRWLTQRLCGTDTAGSPTGDDHGRPRAAMQAAPAEKPKSMQAPAPAPTLATARPTTRDPRADAPASDVRVLAVYRVGLQPTHGECADSACLCASQAQSNAYSRWKNRDPPNRQQTGRGAAPRSAPAREIPPQPEPQPVVTEPPPTSQPAPPQPSVSSSKVEQTPAPAPAPSPPKTSPTVRGSPGRPNSRGGQYEHAGAKVFQNSWSFSDQGLDGGISTTGECCKPSQHDVWLVFSLIDS
jgi:hypothetical protein